MTYSVKIANYDQFIEAFKKLSGLDLKLYKENQMKRRTNNFLNTRGYENDYTRFFQALKSDKELYAAFFQHLTINVTQFYRDEKLWDVFREKVIPELAKKGTPLKMWSAGCSAGQEVYTMASIMEKHFPNVKYSILGTDIDENVLKQAREGFYNERDFSSTPPSIITDFFRPENGKYYVKSILKKNVTFKKQNLLTDSFERGFDLIACRNVVIYFTDQAKDILYKKFSDSLNPGGFFFTGSTEHIFSRSHLKLKSFSSFFYQKQE
ncbi:MAG: CheR family methyltransferase [Desulfitobacteriia bacterium]|jgi:chemotaxis protein methyltransferase CheR